MFLKSVKREVVLLSTTALCGLLALPLAAQAQPASDSSQLQSIEREVNELQAEIREMKAQQARLEHARVEQARAQQALEQQATQQAAAQQALEQQAATQQAAIQRATVQVAQAVPPSAPHAELPPGTFQLGAVTVTLGGYAALEGIWRSRNEAASIDTNFNGNLPLRSSSNYHIPEFRLTAQQSRFSILVQGQPNLVTKLSSYMEIDFLSAGSSSNNNQSNSYTPRVRQFWGMYENSDWGLHVVGGQTWSLATMYSLGLLPRHEQVPLTIDAQYVAGFNWSRQATLRVMKDFDDQKLWAALSIEEPATIFSASASCPAATQPTLSPGYTEENTQCGGPNVNSTTAYSDNSAPDVIAKIAADPGYGHYELYGMVRFLDGRTLNTVTQTGRSYNTTGQGIGAGMILPIVPKVLSFQVSGLIGQGVGRYGTGQLPDVAFSPTGALKPLSEFSVMGGFVAHPTPKIDLYTYGGAEEAYSKSYTLAGAHYGYGITNVSLGGCAVEGMSCSAQTSAIQEFTIGGWYRFIKSAYGTLQAGAQYEYIDRHTFVGPGSTPGTFFSPSANLNAFLFSFRYLPFG